MYAGTINFSNIIVTKNLEIKFTRLMIPIEIYKGCWKDLDVIEDGVFLPPEFIQSNQEGASLVNSVNHKNFRLHLDTKTIMENNEDVEIFSRNLHDMGYMDNRDWETYSDLFKNMTKFLISPDLIIYLKADLDTILERINKRSREYEASIDPEYLKRLNLMYDEWIEGITWT